MPYVDIGFMGLKGGSGGIYGTDGYDHIGMIDASGGVLDQDYEMFEQQTPHLVLKHEYWVDSAGAGPVARRPRRGDHVRDRHGEDTQLVTFGDGDVEPSRGSQGGREGTLNIIQLRYPGEAEWRTLHHQGPGARTCPTGTIYYQQAGGGGGWGDPKQRAGREGAARRAERRGLAWRARAATTAWRSTRKRWTVDEEATKKLRAK